MPIARRTTGAVRLRSFTQGLAGPFQTWLDNERARSAANRAELFSNLGLLPEE